MSLFQNPYHSDHTGEEFDEAVERAASIEAVQATATNAMTAARAAVTNVKVGRSARGDLQIESYIGNRETMPITSKIPEVTNSASGLMTPQLYNDLDELKNAKPSLFNENAAELMCTIIRALDFSGNADANMAAKTLIRMWDTSAQG